MTYGITGYRSEDIKLWLKDGWSAGKIAKEIDCAKSSVSKFIRKNNLSHLNQNKCKINKDNLLKDKVDDVIRMHNDGVSQNEIAKVTGHSGASICMLLNKLGLEARDWKYKMDEAYFEKIDSQDKAYMLGWMYSDGSIDDKGKFRIQIQEEDAYIFDYFQKNMGSDIPIYHIPPPKKFPHRKTQKCLCFNRQSIAKDLISLGCIPNKSLVLKFPDDSQVPKDMMWHFLRGVFDGDGSVSIKGIASLNCSITSSVDFIKGLSKLVDSYRIECNIYDRNKSKSLVFTKSSEAFKFLTLLYNESDKDARLTRKYNKYIEYKHKGIKCA